MSWTLKDNVVKKTHKEEDQMKLERFAWDDDPKIIRVGTTPIKLIFL